MNRLVTSTETRESTHFSSSKKMEKRANKTAMNTAVSFPTPIQLHHHPKCNLLVNPTQTCLKINSLRTTLSLTVQSTSSSKTSSTGSKSSIGNTRTILRPKLWRKEMNSCLILHLPWDKMLFQEQETLMKRNSRRLCWRDLLLFSSSSKRRWNNAKKIVALTTSHQIQRKTLKIDGMLRPYCRLSPTLTTILRSLNLFQKSKQIRK